MIFSVREHSGATASSRYESVSIQEQLRVPISSHHLVVLEVVLESNSNDESMSLMGTYGHPTHPNSIDLNRPGTPTWPHDEAPASSSKIHQRAHEFQRFDEVCGYSPSFGVFKFKHYLVEVPYAVYYSPPTSEYVEEIMMNGDIVMVFMCLPGQAST